MSSYQPILYRVETYIMPEANKFAVQAAIKEIDHLKIANQLQVKNEHIPENNTQNEEDASPVSHNKCMEFARYSVENSTLFGTKTVTNKAKDKILLNKQFDNDNYVKYYKDKNFYHSDKHLNVQKMEFQTSIGLEDDRLYPVRQFRRVNSLMSIDEKSEDSLETKLSDCCYHGYKNGCTATIPSPEEISKKIFKKNWLQKIEILRQREAKLREKEMNLQNREKELFKREKELRITERTLNDKLRQLDKHLKYQRDMQAMDKKLEKTTRVLPESFKEPDEPAKTERFSNSLIYQKCEKSEESDKKIKSSMHLKSDLLSRQSSSTNITSKFHSYASIRYKERPKINYDDLNSTLSADVGDSSFIRTSEKFNPEIYKKPYAFTRSASERWPKQKDSTAITKLQGVIDAEEGHKHIVEEDKVLRKLSENIYASQKKDTKFQNYGLVDCRPDDIQSKMKHNSDSEERLSLCLDVETGDKNSDRRSDNIVKDRPISWNVETNEWLQKKRQAYNLATKQSAENKENLKCNTVIEKDEKISKKIIKNKIFTIFR